MHEQCAMLNLTVFIMLKSAKRHMLKPTQTPITTTIHPAPRTIYLLHIYPHYLCALWCLKTEQVAQTVFSKA